MTTKGFEVHIDIPETNIYALGNEEVLGRVLNNLISNAITYGDEGKVHRITLRDDDNESCISMYGIEEKELMNLILIKYLKVCIHLKIQEIDCIKVAGLGLTITKRLVEAIRRRNSSFQ